MVLSGENADLKKFGDNLRRMRKSQDLSMEALANMADMELSQIARIETGKINPKLLTLLSIAKALKIQPSELFLY